jgi:hypothetical protein
MGPHTRAAQEDCAGKMAGHPEAREKGGRLSFD